jgi:hypothetical protein
MPICCTSCSLSCLTYLDLVSYCAVPPSPSPGWHGKMLPETRGCFRGNRGTPPPLRPLPRQRLPERQWQVPPSSYAAEQAAVRLIPPAKHLRRPSSPSPFQHYAHRLHPHPIQQRLGQGPLNWQPRPAPSTAAAAAAVTPPSPPPTAAAAGRTIWASPATAPASSGQR